MSRLQTAALWASQAAALLAHVAAAPAEDHLDEPASSIEDGGDTTNPLWYVGFAALAIGVLGAGCAQGEKRDNRPSQVSSSNLLARNSSNPVFSQGQADIVYDDVDGSDAKKKQQQQQQQQRQQQQQQRQQQQQPQQQQQQPQQPQRRGAPEASGGRVVFYIRSSASAGGRTAYVEIKQELIREAMRAGESIFYQPPGSTAYMPIRSYEEVVHLLGAASNQDSNEPATYSVVDKKKKGGAAAPEEDDGGAVYKEVPKKRPKSSSNLAGPQDDEEPSGAVYSEVPKKRASAAPELPPHAVAAPMNRAGVAATARKPNADYQNLDSGASGPLSAQSSAGFQRLQDMRDYQNIDNGSVALAGKGPAGYRPVDGGKDYQNIDSPAEVFDGSGRTLGRGMKVVQMERDEDDYVPLKDQGGGGGSLYEPLESTGYDRNNQPLYAPIDSDVSNIAEPTFINLPERGGSKQEPAPLPPKVQQPSRAPPPSQPAPPPSVLGRRDKANLEAWLQDNVSRDEAEAHLLKAGAIQGSYLVRRSNRSRSEYVISMCHERKAFHFRILQTASNEYYVHDDLNNPKKFPDIDQLLHYYKTYDPELAGGLAAYITSCIPHPSSSC